MTSAPVGSAPASRPGLDEDDISTLALSPRAAAMLAYSAGWISGALVLALEGRRLEVRRHAAQSLIGFGTLTLLAAVLLALAGVGVFVSVALFRALLWVVQGVIAVGVVAWLVALVQSALGRSWHWPFVAPYAERLARLGR